MEKLILDQEVDFLELERLTKKALDVVPERKMDEQLDSDVAVIVLKVHNPAFNLAQKSFDIKMWGKTGCEWLSLAFDKCPVTYVECAMESDILTVIKPHLSAKTYTAVFYADTPLITRKTFLSVLDYVKTKRLNVAKLPRGYCFVTEFIRSAANIYSTQSIYCDETDFAVMLNLESMSNVSKILHDRIIDYHRQNGILIIDGASVFIDADVVIGKNVTIHPNNHLRGLSVIKDGVILEPNNIITNSRIEVNTKITSSVIENSDIKPNSEIKPFSHIVGGAVQKGNKK